MDKYVFAGYAKKHLPKAIGYSASLLQYFFRGEIDMVHAPNVGAGYVIKNRINEPMAGEFSLYYDADDGTRKQIGDAPVLVTTNENPLVQGVSSEVIVFTPPGDAIEPGKYMLVFQGKMGNEEGAVAGKMVNLKAFYLNILRDDGNWMTPDDMVYPDPEDHELFYYALEVISGANGYGMIVNIDWADNYTLRISMPQRKEDVDNRHPYKEYWWPVAEGGPDGEWPLEGVWLEFWGSLFHDVPSFQVPYIYLFNNWEEKVNLQQPGRYIVQSPYWSTNPYTIRSPGSSVEYACSSNGQQSGRGPINVSHSYPPQPPYYEKENTTYFDRENSVERGFNVISSIPYQINNGQVNSFNESRDEYRYPVYSWVYYGHLGYCVNSEEGPPPLWEAVNEDGTVIGKGGDLYHKQGMWGTADEGGVFVSHMYDNTFVPYAPVTYRRHFRKVTNISTGSRQFSYKAYYDGEWHTRQAFYNWTKGISYGYPTVRYQYNGAIMAEPPPLPDPLPPLPSE